MTVKELIYELAKYPDHSEVKLFLDHNEKPDYFGVAAGPDKVILMQGANDGRYTD